jgi:hypothetical protein
MVPLRSVFYPATTMGGTPINNLLRFASPLPGLASSSRLANFGLIAFAAHSLILRKRAVRVPSAAPVIYCIPIRAWLLIILLCRVSALRPPPES